MNLQVAALFLQAGPS